MIPRTSNHNRKALISFGLFALVGITAVWFDCVYLFMIIIIIPVIVACAFGDIKIKLKPNYMSVKIQPADNEEFNVNGKTVYKDSNGNWLSNPQLTDTESRFFGEYLITLSNAKIKKPLTVTYKQ